MENTNKGGREAETVNNPQTYDQGSLTDVAGGAFPYWTSQGSETHNYKQSIPHALFWSFNPRLLESSVVGG